MSFRLHVVGLPHAPTSREHCSCAYTSKILKFCKMMAGACCEVFHYGTAGSNPVCTENVTTLSGYDYQKSFGGHDYKKTYYPVEWDASLPYWQLSNASAALEIRRRARRGDFLCLIGGLCQMPIADALADLPLIPVEYGIGYYGTFAPFRVFESYAHMHHCYGRQSQDPDGKWFDCVIPNYFDVQDFTFRPKPRQKNPYALFMGRMIRRKGIEVAIEACARAGMKLFLSGQGATQEGDTIVTSEGTFPAMGASFVGYSDHERRDELMGNATCLLAPTFYLEPFGGVAVEAQLTGTPAVTSDWGAFPETVSHGVTGYRCRTVEQFTWAVKNCHSLDRGYIRQRAIINYSLESVAAMYLEYFGMLWTLWGEGFYARNDSRHNLNWLRKV